MSDTDRRLVLGAMTGTSLDGIDAALVDVRGRGLGLRARLRDVRTAPLDRVGDDLRRVAEGAPTSAADIARLALELGRLHAGVLGALADDAPGAIDLCAVHGQTVHHAPPLSWQLLNPAPIADRLRCPIVFDLRQADLVAGGQGAPITPLADWILFRATHARAIVNLGGFCNVTILPASIGTPADIRAFDACPCNHVLDRIARRHLGRPYDDGGRAALGGTFEPSLAATVEAALPGAPGTARSLGTGDEADDLIDRFATHLAPADVAALACDAIARRITGALDVAGTAGVAEIVLAGGGAHNAALVAALDRHSEAPVTTSAAHGVPVHAREALAMAVLGALTADGIPITLPNVTGCARPAPLAGTWIVRA